MTRIDQSRGSSGVAGSAKLWTGTVVSVAILLLVIWYLVPSPYGETSENGYDYTVALYKICNQKDTKRLETFASLLDDAAAAAEISDEEFVWLKQIVGEAREGKWHEAQTASRELLEAQADRP